MIGWAFGAKNVTTAGRLEKEGMKVPGQLEKIRKSSCRELNPEYEIGVICFLSV